MPGWSELLPEAEIRKLAIYMGAGGRICFDGAGHVFISIGVKGRAISR